jgi:hypothetical protein
MLDLSPRAVMPKYPNRVSLVGPSISPTNTPQHGLKGIMQHPFQRIKGHTATAHARPHPRTSLSITELRFKSAMELGLKKMIAYQSETTAKRTRARKRKET